MMSIYIIIKLGYDLQLRNEKNHEFQRSNFEFPDASDKSYLT